MPMTYKLVQLTNMWIAGEQPQPQTELNTPDNQQTMSVYYDPEWVAGKRDIVVYISNEPINPEQSTTRSHQKYITDQGYIYVRLHPYANKPFWYESDQNYPMYDFFRDSYEPEVVMNELFKELIKDQVLSKWIKSNSRVVLAGFGRGAEAVLSWSRLTRSGFKSPNSSKVIGIVTDTPSVSSLMTEGAPSWNSPDQIQRALFNQYQQCNHKCTGVSGAGDKTNVPRSLMELIYTFVTNPNVTIRVIGDVNYTYGWSEATTYNQYIAFCDIILEHFK